MLRLEPIHRGDVVFVHVKSATGCKTACQKGDRPAIVVSNDKGNTFSPVVEIVYLTSQQKKPLPTHVRIFSGVKFLSIALCEQIDTIDKDKIQYCSGHLTPKEMGNLNRAIAISLGIMQETGTSYNKSAL